MRSGGHHSYSNNHLVNVWEPSWSLLKEINVESIVSSVKMLRFVALQRQLTSFIIRTRRPCRFNVNRCHVRALADSDVSLAREVSNSLQGHVWCKFRHWPMHVQLRTYDLANKTVWPHAGMLKFNVAWKEVHSFKSVSLLGRLKGCQYEGNQKRIKIQ